MVVDNRTPHRSYALPDPANNLSDDVFRLINALESVDEDVQGLSDAVAGKAEASHTHEISDVNGLQAALDGKAAGSHTHALDDLSDVDTSGAANGQFLKRIGTSWGPATIQIGDINALENALNSKAGLQGTALIVPYGTTGQRPSSPVGPLMRFNTTLGLFEAWDGTSWVPLVGGNFVSFSHAQTLTPTQQEQARANIGLGNSATRNVGTTSGTVAAGDDSRLTGALQRSGDTMTGPLALSGNPTNNLHAATKGYVDAKTSACSGVARNGNHTLTLSDAGTSQEMTSSSSSTLTVPPNSSVAFPVGTVVNVEQHGAGQVTIAAGSGVTIRSRNGLKLAGQYAVATLRKVATNTWIAAGDLTT